MIENYSLHKSLKIDARWYQNIKQVKLRLTMTSRGKTVIDPLLGLARQKSWDMGAKKNKIWLA